MIKNSFLIFLIFLLPLKMHAAEIIAPGSVLSLNQCINIALKNHPALAASEGTLKAAESRIGQVRAGYYPQIVFQSGYSRIGPALNTPQSDPYHHYSNSLSLNQTIFDFGKTWTSVDIASLHKASVEADYQDVRATVILGVRQTYFSFLKARMSQQVAMETVDQFKQHYEIAKTFFETGKSSKIDVTSAEVNLSNARIQLISAQNTLSISRAALNQAMGITSTAVYDVIEEFQHEQSDVSFEMALAQAYKNRPDILSMNRKKEAFEKTVNLQKRGFLPVLSGNAGYGYSGEKLTSDSRSWNIGIALTFPLFTGLSTKYAIDEAQANLYTAEANEESLRQNVFLEVQSACLTLHAASEQMKAGKLIVRQAQETLELAKGRYSTGMGSSIEITDAMIKLNNAKMTYIAALSDFNIAQANLEKAIGVKK